MQDICVTIIMKKRPGRPKIGTENAKGIFFAARFTPVEAKQIESAIIRSGLSKSKFIRKSLLSACETVNVTQ
jgi:hypothetical protein